MFHHIFLVGGHHWILNPCRYMFKEKCSGLYPENRRINLLYSCSRSASCMDLLQRIKYMQEQKILSLNNERGTLGFRIQPLNSVAKNAVQKTK